MYAGFWKRFGAFAIDWSVLLMAEIIFIFIWAGFELLLNLIGFEQEVKKNILGVLGAPIYLSIPWLYYAIFESSNMMSTPGKRAMGVVVVDVNGNKISFKRASIRYWSKFISAILFLGGFIISAFTKKKQALHDFIASTYVINKDKIHFENKNDTINASESR